MSKLNIMTIGSVDNVVAMFGLTGKITSVMTSYYNEPMGPNILSIFGCKRNTRGVLSIKLVVEQDSGEIHQDMTFDIDDQKFANLCIVNLKDQIEKHNNVFDIDMMAPSSFIYDLPPLISMPSAQFIQKCADKMVTTDSEAAEANDANDANDADDEANEANKANESNESNEANESKEVNCADN